MAVETTTRGLGWLRDFPDFRDYTVEASNVDPKQKARGQDSVKAMRSRLGVGKPRKNAAPAKVDLRQWCPAIEDQGNLGSCTANAGVGLVEYFERRAAGKYIDASRLFLYKVTRNLMHEKGDTGAYLRTTMSALTLFGVPPEDYCKYDIADFDKEPGAFCYAFAQNYQSITYYRLDPPETSATALLDRIKSDLAAGLPSMFGFTVYSSISQANDDGQIPFPTSGEKVEGGHAIVAVGYDDGLKIKNANGGTATKGALLIRNSWGKDWGEAGYGWLPYDYVLRGLAVDWWSILKNEWVDTGQFKVD